METNVFTLQQLKEATAPKAVASGVSGPQDILKLVEKVVDTVQMFKGKADKFQETYGRAPQNKQEMKKGVPYNPTGEVYSRATQEQMIRKQYQEQDQQKQIDHKGDENVNPYLDKEMLDNWIDANIENLLNKAQEHKDKKISEVLLLLKFAKTKLVKQLKQEAYNNIKEMIKLAREERKDTDKAQTQHRE